MALPITQSRPSPTEQEQIETHVQPTTSKQQPKARKKLFDFKGQVEKNERIAEENAGRPDNLFSRKAWVVAVFALLVWSYYVFVGRLCAPMIQKHSDSGGSKGQGIGLLIGFNILWLMFIWSYIRIISTSPGIAPHHIPQSEPPFVQPEWQYMGSSPGHISGGEGKGDRSGSAIEGNHMGSELGQGSSPAQKVVEGYKNQTMNASQANGNGHEDEHEDRDRDPGTLDSVRNMIPPEIAMPSWGQTQTTSQSQAQSHPTSYRYSGEGRGSSGSDTIVAMNDELETRASPSEPDASMIMKPIPETPHHHPSKFSSAAYQNPNQDPSLSKPVLSTLIERPFPPPRPYQAYCYHCKIYKPFRSHHCRHCGVCVLGMDHHCPWIGQCVGWRNHKFFNIFSFWSTLFTIYTLVVFATKIGAKPGVDGQMVALIVISAFFTLLTGALLWSHIQMTLSALTTIESYTLRSQHDRERRLLSTQFGFFSWRLKRKVIKRWKREYGDMGTEGNRWWVGGVKREWTMLMGDSVLGWILPIGHPKGDGITFEQNPRFSPSGERRKRDEWPAELR